MNQQLTHRDIHSSESKNRVTIICDGVSSPANMGGLFRLCDAFGVDKLIFADVQVDLSSSRLRRTARSTEKKVSFESEANILQCIATHKQEGYVVIGLEITSGSEPIQQLSQRKACKYALVIGNEQEGISQTVLEVLDQTYHIEMFGQNSSMNVTQATAIALFELTKS